MTAPIRLALIGFGKIAHDQHLPVIDSSGSFDLAAIVDRHGEGLGKLAFFRDITELAASGIDVDAVVLCTPPQVRRPIASYAIEQGWHVLMEKPPAATLAEAIALRDQASAQDVSLFASWHSRYAGGVEPARAWLSDRVIRKATITWREDVRAWHPGQDWIWEPGGFGVFDPGINALSIVTRILPRPIFVERAEIDVPANRAAPIAARVDFRDGADVPVTMDLDFRQEGPQRWDIEVETDAGTLKLANGGAVLSIPDGQSTRPGAALHGEYARLYRRFAAIVRAGVSDVDVSPLRLVSDTFMRARFRHVEDFCW